MDQDRWEKIEALYSAVLRLDPADRSSRVAQLCAGDEDLRLDVLSLLESAETSDSFLEEPALSFGLRVIGLENDALLGENLARYKILKTLGHGGMGEVYLALDPRLNRLVALKLLPASITDDRGRVRRFEQEARAASAISHPNVAHIYEIGEVDGRHYITMEYIKGPTLRQLLRSKALDPGQAVEIAIQVATALSAAHRAGVIHRDIKPENILLAEDGYVKVLDFGLAKLVDDRKAKSNLDSLYLSSIHTEPELFMGTSYYMSPEQVRRQPADLRTDLWSLGVVIYEMLTFRRPFQGQLSDVIVEIIEKEPELAVSAHFSLPHAVQAFLSKALGKRAEDRFQTADEMLSGLRNLQLQEPQTAHSQTSGGFDKTTGGSVDTATDRDSITTAAEALRFQTLPRRFDTVSDEDIPGRSKFSILSKRLVLVLAGLLVITVGAYYGSLQKQPRTLAGGAINPRFDRLNLSGNISDMVLSPDGNYVAYVVTQDGKYAIHVMELATASDLRVVTASDEGYSGLSFSPDGTFLYYLENHAETGTLYRVSKLGGGQRKILANVNTPVTFSPDGSQMAFVRSNKSAEPADLIIAQADGTSERVFVKRTLAEKDFFLSDMRGAGPVWSPDGTVLACPTFRLNAKPQEFYLEMLDAQSGTGRLLNAKPWHDLKRVVWLADGSGLIVAAIEKQTMPAQLEMISYPSGMARKLTNDPNNYALVSTSRDSNLLLALNIEENSSVWRVSTTEGASSTALAVEQKKGALEVEWDGDGRLLYTISDGTHKNVWSQGAGAATPIQLTFESDNYMPTLSPDRRYLVFVSQRTGTSNIWRANADGTQPTRLTTGSYEDMPSVTPDGNWVIYRNGSGVRKVSIQGGSPVKLIEKLVLYPALSPEGSFLAYFTSDRPDSPDWRMEVYDLTRREVVVRFELSKGTSPFNAIRWTPDGQGLTYVSNANGNSNLWLQSIGGGSPRQLTHFSDGEVLSFDWAKDRPEITCVRSTKAHVSVLLRLF